MARAINTSFEFADGVAHLDTYGSRTGSAGVTLDSTVVRTGTKSLKVVSAASANYWLFDAPDDTLATYNIAIRVSAAPSSGTLTVLAAVGASHNLSFLVNTSGSLVALVTGGVTVNSGVNVCDGAWHFLRCKLDTTTTTYRITWELDGTARTDATGVAGGNTAGASITGLRVGNPVASATGTIWYDDFAWDADHTLYPLAEVSADPTDAPKATALAASTLSVQSALFPDAPKATAVATSILSAQSTRFAEMVRADATGAAVLSAEVFVPPAIYTDLVKAVATASASPPTQAFWITDTLTAAALAPPLLSREEARFPQTARANGLGGASLSAQVYDNGASNYTDLVTARIVANASLSVQDVCQVIKPTEDAAAIINAAADGSKFDLAQGRHAITATIRPPLNCKIIGRGPATQLDRSTILTGWRSLGSGLWEWAGGALPGAIKVEGFTVSLRYPQSIWANTLYRDALPLKKVGVRQASTLYGTDETTLQNDQCFIDFDADRIVVKVATALDLGAVLALSKPSDIISSSQDNVTVEQLYIFGSAQRGIRGLGNNWKIRFNEVRGNTVCVTLKDNAECAYNKILYGGQYCWSAGGSQAAPIPGIKFHHNEVAHGDFLDMQRPLSSPTDTRGSMWGNGSCKFTHTRNISITDNWMHDSTMGIWGDLSNQGGYIARNTIEDIEVHGIHWEVSYSVTVEDNIIRRCGDRCYYQSTSQDGIIRRNTLDARGGKWALHIVDDASRSQSFDFAPLRGINNTAEDNIVYLDAGAQHGVQKAGGAANPDNQAYTTNHFSRNIYVAPNPTGGPYFSYNGSGKTFSLWKATGQDTTGSIATTLPVGPVVGATYTDAPKAAASAAASVLELTYYPDVVHADGHPVGAISAESTPLLFGKQTGGTQSNFTCGTGTAYVSDFTLGADGDDATLRRVFVWIDGLGSATTGQAFLRGIIYDGAGAQPVNLVGRSTNEVTVGRASNKPGFWAEFNFDGQDIHLPAGKYWLGIHVGGVTNVVRLLRDARTAAFHGQSDLYADGTELTWTNTIVGGYEISAYAEVDSLTTSGQSYTDLVSANASAGALISGDEVVIGGGGGGWVGVGSRVAGSSTDITAFMNANPTFKITGGMIYWSVLEASPNTYRWGDTDAGGTKIAEASWTGLMRSLKSARDSRSQPDGGWKLILRISCGVDAPKWLKTTAKPKKAGETGFPGNRPVVEFMDTIGTDVQRVPISFPVPWDPSLLLAYNDLIREVDRKMRESDGNGGTWGDHVYYVPICLPTEQGTEMTMGYGQAEHNPDGTPADEAWWPGVNPDGTNKTGVYKGVTHTGKWRVFTRINEDEWLRISSANTGWTPTNPPPAQISAYTSAQQSAGLSANKSDLAQAWVNATRVHGNLLNTVPSGVAFGTLFGDNNVGAGNVLDDCIARHFQSSIWFQSTDLRTGSSAPYRYAQFSFSRHQLFLRAKDNGFIIGFQTAGSSFFGTSVDQRLPVSAGQDWSGRSKFEWALEDARDTYDSKWIETVPTQSFITLHQPYYNNYQRTLGGGLPGQFLETVTVGAVTGASLSAEAFTGVPTAFYDTVTAAGHATALLTSELNQYADTPATASAVATASLVGQINEYADVEPLTAPAGATAALSQESAQFSETLTAAVSASVSISAYQEFLIGEVIFVETVTALGIGGASVASDTWDPYLIPAEIVSIECYDVSVVVDITPRQHVVDVADPIIEVDL